MADLSGKVALATGGASGLGECTARLMAAKGAKVMVADIDFARAQRVAQSIVADGGIADAVAFDLHDAASIAAMADATIAAFGGVDILFANAADLAAEAAQYDIDAETIPVDVFDRIVHANLRGTMLCAQSVLPLMKGRGGGALVFTGSALSLRGNAGQIAYSTTKAALIQLSRSIATSHGPFNIRSNLVLPGLTMTDHIKKVLAKPFIDMVLDETLLPRLTMPVDVAKAVVFLASDDAAAITGQYLVVDGGESVHFPGIGKLREIMQSGLYNEA